MKTYYKGLFSGILVVVLVISSLPAFAATSKTISAIINSISVTINGKSIAKDNLVYGGKVYINAQTLSSVLNKDFVWDKKKNVVSIKDKSTASSTTTVSPIIKTGLSRSNPASIGTTLNLVYEDTFDKYSANVTLIEVERGTRANEKVIAANMFNEEPNEGFEYMLAKIKFDLIKSKNMYELLGFQFNLVSTSGKVYPAKLVSLGDLKIDAGLYEGSSSEGYVAFLVEKSDLTPTIAFGRKYDGSGGIWFKTNK